jgi:hypothetical protein
MGTAQNGGLYYEAGQTPVAMAALTDAGAHTVFSSTATRFSLKSGYTPVIRPNGLITGGAVTPHADNDKLSITAFTCYLAGVLTSVNTGTLSITRGGSGVTYMINSLTVTSAGALATVTGTGHATAFSEVRAAAGGPPLIPVGSIEIAQIRTITTAPAAVTTDEIYAVVGNHREHYAYPSWIVSEEAGTITFSSALPLSHTGVIPKAVYASGYQPVMSLLENIADVVLPETTNSITSKEVYGGAIGAVSSSIGQGAFTAYLSDGISDPLLQQKNQKIWFDWYPNKNATPCAKFNGIFGVSRTFPAGDSIHASCTVTAEKAATEVTA